MRAVLLLLLMSFTLQACGIKGALYIPEQRYPQTKTTQPAQSTPSVKPTP